MAFFNVASPPEKKKFLAMDWVLAIKGHTCVLAIFSSRVWTAT